METMKQAGICVAVVLALVSLSAHAQSYIRTDVIEYHDNLGQWVVGQTAKVTNANTGLVVSETQYGAYALPWKTYSFGKLQQTLTYNPDGTLTTASDGRDGVNGAETTITLSSWKRGIPQSIRYPATTESPAGATESAVVGDDGTIGSVTDENGYKTCYEYDAMGRVIKITYPSGTQVGVCDTSTWTPTTITFAGGNTGAYGMPAGHWRQTVLTGNGRKVLILDALWRPVVEQDLDLGDVSNTVIEIVRQYDAAGRLKFQSYPMNTVGQVNYASTTLTGTRNTYDSLDRLRIVTQDSELGPLTTTTDYLNDANGPYTQVTNPRGYVTRIWFQLFDQPVYDKPETIAHPEGAFTHINRDVFGKPTALRRSNSSSPTGGTMAVNRTYTYNGYQELCRTDEPETGSSFMGYDAAGNLSWSAAGYTAAGAGCSTSTAVAARRADRTYDARNRIKGLTFADGNGDATYSYYTDGQLQSLTADNGGKLVTSSYEYNTRRLLTHERLQWTNGATVIDWPVAYAYNTNGHLSAQSWHGLNVDYAPNALGQPSKAGTFATGVSYYPNGAIKQFTYGNGIVHTLTQNVRGLPDTSMDAYGTTSFLNDGYDYDKNGNVAGITDGATGRNQRSNRTMTYDGLDRLKTVVSPMYGAVGANYTYDVLDNLARANLGGTGARDHYYCYDGNLRLTNIKTGGCGGTSVIGLGYDLQGNLQNKNGAEFRFDMGNRLRKVGPLAVPTSEYAYDGHGRRIWDRTSDDKYSHYTLDGRLSMTGDDRAGKVAEYIYLGSSLVAIRERDVPTNVYTYKYQHTDSLGSPVVVTDGSKNVLKRSEYEPYGATQGEDGPGYTGHVFDAATGMNYMQQRYYDPQIGRFLSVDPVTANSGTGANFNRYWYASNNPYKFVDPDGRAAWCATGPGGCSSAIVHSIAGPSQGGKQSLDSTSVSGSRGRGGGTSKVGPRVEGVRNPGPIFNTPQDAAKDVHAQVDALSIARNKEIHWHYFFERKFEKFGYSDPYWTDRDGGERLALPFTINGVRRSQTGFTISGVYGHGHTHGNYSDASGRAVPRAMDTMFSDQFSGDDKTVHQTSGLRFFSLGTPSGVDLQWTPANGEEPLR